MKWHESSVMVIDGSIPLMWWGDEDKAGSAPHICSALPYLDQKQQLENQVLWLIVTFSADYRGALG